MSDEDASYEQTLDRAARELSSLMEESEEIDDRREKIARRMQALRDMVFALCNVVGEDPYITRPELFPEIIEPETGFTDAVREVLRSSNKYLSPVDIRDILKQRRFNLEKYRNPLAAIHQILSRLVGSGEVEKHEEDKLYKWQPVPDGTPLPSHGAGGGLASLRSPSADPQTESAMNQLIRESVNRKRGKGVLGALAEELARRDK